MSEQPWQGIDESLDPHDWDAFRHLAHRTLDAAIDLVEHVRKRPAWTSPPAAVRDALKEALPLEGVGTARACDDALRWVLPYGTGNIHPRFFGWVHGSGTAGGIIATMLASAMNANLGGREQGAVYVERQVIDWCKQLFQMPAEATGLLVSGTSLATLIGLAVARNALAGANVRYEGVASVAPLCVYTSTEAHVSVIKAAEMLGLGARAVRQVPVDADFRMDVEALRHMIEEDATAGRRPLCVVGTAGTVNTGAIDDLWAIGKLCRNLGIWFHVDAAFGAALQLSKSLSHRLHGIEAADSVAFDFHKWMHVQYDAGCILVRDGASHFSAFSTHAAYLNRQPGGVAGGHPWFCDFGPELSRGFRALKVWFTLRELGLRRLGEKVAENCEQAQWLATRINTEERLELMAAVSLNIVCFRYRAPGLEGAALDRFNEELLVQVHESGIAVPSSTRISNSFVMRIALTNHRTSRGDLERTVSEILTLGARMEQRKNC